MATKRKYKDGAVVTNINELLEHDFFILHNGIHAHKTVHRAFLEAWQLHTCDMFVKGGLISIAEPLTNGEYYCNKSDEELLDMFCDEICGNCEGKKSIIGSCDGKWCEEGLERWKGESVV